MNRLSGRRVVVAVRAVKVGVTAAAAGTAVVLTFGGAIATPGHDATPSSDASARLAERVALHVRCADAPGRAIIQTADGRTRAVPFEQGWRVYRGRRPGALIAVCPD